MTWRNCILIALCGVGIVLAPSIVGCAPQPNPPPTSGSHAHVLSESFYIKQAVLRDFFDLQLKGAGGAEKNYYSAFVLNDNVDGNDLVASFAGYVPLVSNTIDVSTSTGEARDQKTGTPVKVFTVIITDQSPVSATVRARSFEDNSATETDEYEVKKLDGKWLVESHRPLGSP